MLNLVELLVELKALAAGSDADKLERINALLSNPRNPAEFQIGRHLIARLVVPEVDRMLDSVDPRERKTAIATARLAMTKELAARALRRVFHDPDPVVRVHARRTTIKLGLHGARHTSVRMLDMQARHSGIAEFPATWAFGIFATSRSPKRGAPKRAQSATALERYALPPLADDDAIAQLVGVDELAPLMRPGTGPGSGYVEFEVPKAKGGTRRIAAPRAELRRVQRAILEKILAKVPLHDACHGFVAGRSTVTNARPHAGAALVVKLDLKDFFPTVHYRRVRGLFQSLGYSAAVANTLAGLTTYRPKLDDGRVVWPGLLPQGAPTSPALANLACRRLDVRLAKLAAKYGATYTRYADDLTFSFAKPPEIKLGRFLWWASSICEREGFIERPEKRRVLRAKHQQRVTGIVVNAGVHVPREDRRRFRAILHNCAKHGVAAQARGREDFAAYLAGYAAYVHMVEPALGKRWIAEVDRLLAKAGG